MTTRHDQLVQRQFGSTAADYVTSAVHASGADLLRIARIAAGTGPARALDLGCGGGHVSYAVAPHAGELVACDLSTEMLAAVSVEAARRGIGNITTVNGAAEALPFADGEFDFLTCRFSTHHWGHAPAGLGEARRVLRAGAPGVFVDVVAPDLAAADSHLQAVELLRDPSHGRDYRIGEWRAMLDAAGFAIVAVEPARLRMDFAVWTARMRTPPVQIAAIRALQQCASAEVAKYFEIEDDGSFIFDTVLIEIR
jgi:ubiquinone/menaquinone biosynthesis C-methylase UbiE